MTASIPPISLPDIVPETLPSQKYQLGEWVYWHQVPNPDFGRIIGVVYTKEASCSVAGLHYLVFLDKNSPSSSLTSCDFAFSEDIKPLPPENLAKLRENND